jgi:hypothetical protein
MDCSTSLRLDNFYIINLWQRFFIAGISSAVIPHMSACNKYRFRPKSGGAGIPAGHLCRVEAIGAVGRSDTRITLTNPSRGVTHHRQSAALTGLRWSIPSVPKARSASNGARSSKGDEQKRALFIEATLNDRVAITGMLPRAMRTFARSTITARFYVFGIGESNLTGSPVEGYRFRMTEPNRVFAFPHRIDRGGRITHGSTEGGRSA